MAIIWTVFLLFSIFCALLTKQTGALSAAVLQGAGQGVTLAISLAGPLCLWSGVNRVLENTGLTTKLSRLLAPLLGRLFPKAWQDKTAREAISANVSANLLGLGGAATPPGIRAVRQMALGLEGRVSNELCRFVVLNTASVQLIPATVAAIRAAQGAAKPFDILPAVWLTSVCSVAVGLLTAKGLERWT